MLPLIPASFQQFSEKECGKTHGTIAGINKAACFDALHRRRCAHCPIIKKLSCDKNCHAKYFKFLLRCCIATIEACTITDQRSRKTFSEAQSIEKHSHVRAEVYFNFKFVDIQLL